jgi:rhodanese-related sulfurtransferase
VLGQQQIFLLLVMFFYVGNAYATKPVAPESIDGVVSVSAAEVVELILSIPELVVVDSRYHEEYAKGHIEGSVNILNTDMTADTLDNFTGNLLTPVLFYCNGERCLRSSRAAKKAVTWGYKNIYWFRKGWLEWIDKQYPIEY